MNLTGIIESAEYQFKNILEEFFIGVYDNRYLSSHGIDHHRRVWNYSKELLILYADRNSSTLSHLPQKLIIASYLHDIGMSVENGIRHGKQSRDICIQFLNRYHLPVKNYSDVLAAIEYHDIKDYSGNSSVSDLLTFLSVADDLDAFGFTGIFRYSEIYLARGITPVKIGDLIKTNARQRFENFVNTFGYINELVEKHKKRYEILDLFFTNYTKQAANYLFGNQNPSGYCGVIELINDITRGKITFKNLFINYQSDFSDSVIRWYIEGLISESPVIKNIY